MPLVEADDGGAVRREGRGPGRRAAGRAAGPAGCRPVRDPRWTRSRPASPTATAALLDAVRALPTPLAVRSSAVGEDSAGASFAGQHITVLNVPSAEDVEAAVREVWWSANSDSAITYRKRLGVFARPSVGVVVQSLLAAGHGRGDVHAQPDHRRGRADDRGELGSGRGGGLRPGHPRLLPGGPQWRGARASCGTQEVRDPFRPGRRHRGRGRRPRPGGVAVPERRAAAGPVRPGRRLRAGVRRGARHRVGLRGRTALPAAVPRADDVGGRRGAGARRRHRRSWPSRCVHVPLFSDLAEARPRRHRATLHPADVRAGRDRHQGGVGRGGVLPHRVGHGHGDRAAVRSDGPWAPGTTSARSH